ncbi:family 31 glycosyltransferase [Melampsora americana]|nr:family 31 glycosyltransferase [Melampsora americana]
MGKLLLPSSIVITPPESSGGTTPQGSPRPHLVSLLASKKTLRRHRLIPFIICTCIVGFILIISPTHVIRNAVRSSLYFTGLRSHKSVPSEAYARILPVVGSYDPSKVGLEAFPQWNSHPLPFSSWRRWAQYIDLKSHVLQNVLMPDQVPIHTFPREIVLSEDAPEPSDLMFGIATTAERATILSHLWSHWLNPNPNSNSTLPSCIVLLGQSDFDLDTNHTISKAEELSNTLHSNRQLSMCQVIGTQVRHSSRYEIRYFALLKEMDDIARSKDQNPKWYVIGDDDTVWVDERMLRRELTKYDPDKKWFLGTTSEAVAQLNTFGNIAYGGGGIIISRGLFKEMLKQHESCLEDNKDVFGGDEIYTRCAAQAMGNGATKDTVLTPIDSLHQMDVPGDGTGLFQSGIPFMSLHHMWHGWTDAFAWDHPTSFHHEDNDLNQLLLLLKAASFLGGDNLFRRSVHGDGSQLLSLGYTITIYDKPLAPQDTKSVEYTWSYDGYELRYPSRPRIPETEEVGTGGKRTYYLSQLEISPDGQSATFIHLDKWKNRMDILWGEPYRNKKHRSTARWH